MNTTKKQLKEVVKSFAARGVEARASIQGLKGKDREHAWNDKRDIGQGARAALLAYAFVRKMPYRVLEKKCVEDASDWGRRKLVLAIHQALVKVDPETMVLKEHIKDWMSVPVTLPVEEVAPEMKEEAAE